MNITELIIWCKKYSIEEKTVEAFEGFLSNYKIDNLEEYKTVFGTINKEDLKYQIHTMSLNLGNWPKCTYNTVSASMRIFYKDKHICNYKILYTFDGTSEDDFFDVV